MGRNCVVEVITRCEHLSGVRSGKMAGSSAMAPESGAGHPDEIGLDGGKELAGFVHAFLDPLAFRVEPGVVVGQKPVVLFFGEDLGQSNRHLSRFDQVQAKQSSDGSMRGDGHVFGKQHGAGGMKNGVIGP
mgnify:CR=1 FL=1